ncbi:hypothetical protein [Priestia megaterium]|uniref:hypothetical protein n=1 Tax=Priestia megaterium TaxID=1404 RepID=UPI000BFDA2EF|nr:hypothetical protein [Priestia megaterium]PGQ88263.1 hypothetical protein COA18_04870 [Priestia megaterium]
MKSLYKGAQTVFREENESSVLHFTKTMLENNIAIEEIDLEDSPEASTWINVLHQNTVAGVTVDAAIYTVYTGDYLAPIQMYGIIKNIFELWEENSPQDFIELIHHMSVAYQSSSIQSKLNHSDDIMYAIKNRIDLLKSLSD